MDLTSFTNVSSLLGILAPVFVVLGFVWLWLRTESRHVLMYRLWRLLHGSQPINDSEVSAYIEEQSSLMSFRFLTGVRVKSLASARQLIQWTKFHDIEIQTIGWCGDYFDTELRKVRINKLPSAWLQRLKIGLTTLALVTTVAMSAGMVPNDAMLKFKATDNWFFLNAEQATVIWPLNAKTLKKSDCKVKAQDNTQRTFFSDSEVVLICSMLISPESPAFIRQTVFIQRLAFAIVVIVFSLLTWTLFWECVKFTEAKRLDERHLNPDIAGGQISLQLDEN